MTELINPTAEKRRRGRPRLAPEDRKMNFAIRLHQEDGELLKLHALHRGVSQSKLVSMALKKLFDEALD
jgi:hypothetical protein